MFYKKRHDSSISTIYGDINIDDVEGLGRYTERHQQTIRTTGSNSINELSNKTALGVNQGIEVTDFALVTPDIQAIMCLCSASECTVDTTRSLMQN